MVARNDVDGTSFSHRILQCQSINIVRFELSPRFCGTLNRDLPSLSSIRDVTPIHDKIDWANRLRRAQPVVGWEIFQITPLVPRPVRGCCKTRGRK